MLAKITKTGATLALGALVFCGTLAAQQTTAPTEQPAGPHAERGFGKRGFGKGEGRGGFRMGKHGRHGKGHGMGRMLRDLNLTDAQRTQLRELHERQRAQFAPQMEEMRQLMQQKRAGTLDTNGTARLEQMRATFKAQHEANRTANRNALLAILTPEQRAQVEQREKERKERGLNLTDTQREQVKTLHQRYRQQNAAKFDEMRKLHQQQRTGTLDTNSTARLEQLRGELKASQEAQRNEMLNLLTPEQRTKFEQMKQQRGGFRRGGNMR